MEKGHSMVQRKERNSIKKKKTQRKGSKGGWLRWGPRRAEEAKGRQWGPRGDHGNDLTFT